MEGVQQRNLQFLGIGRIRDAAVLASRCEVPDSKWRSETEAVFVKLLEAAKLKLGPSQRQRLQWNDGLVCCLVDNAGILLYCVVISNMEYPERHAFALLADLMSEIQQHYQIGDGGEGVDRGGETAAAAAASSSSSTGAAGGRLSRRILELSPGALTRAFGRKMGELMQAYENPAHFDRIHGLLGKVDAVKGVMQDNVSKILSQSEDLQALTHKSEQLSTSARQFEVSSRQVRVQAARRYYFWWFITLLVLVAIGGIFLWIYWPIRHTQPPAPSPHTAPSQHIPHAPPTPDSPSHPPPPPPKKTPTNSSTNTSSSHQPPSGTDSRASKLSHLPALPPPAMSDAGDDDAAAPHGGLTEEQRAIGFRLPVFRANHSTVSRVDVPAASSSSAAERAMLLSLSERAASEMVGAGHRVNRTHVLKTDVQMRVVWERRQRRRQRR
ncbi:unnamed protein product [Vitrella brassicaformis CCMP3155]|uniref:V-SNARE coiled-coil homology domain-containing protein n=1 Tax=Vitrella brassicaformis (strain CCMP3155) TaxID=1169540 RepID=A0A0G4G512_VITBC|nr:unnamed protein product [Vitrella brassicaformis CCMP3155]|mmetsp:Transcript_14718/g.42350  ORF Transcript_14718/g.42350 Transcript_14718/m.42350 type:complete len:439 (+) Transcript_14718:84-1400(+)|eukprot:CEM23192.1 unnamed protein product [Vitrella brassicaformis CCMP3155]